MTTTPTRTVIYGCSECQKVWRRWQSAAKHITRVHDGAAVVTETPVPPRGALGDSADEEVGLQQKAVASGGALTPGDVQETERDNVGS
jgi:hypothetical protein